MRLRSRGEGEGAMVDEARDDLPAGAVDLADALLEQLRVDGPRGTVELHYEAHPQTGRPHLTRTRRHSNFSREETRSEFG